MVAGSRLSMERTEKVPPARGWVASAMNQFMEANLSCPRGPVCWMSVRKATPWSMRVQRWASGTWSMAMGEAAGLKLVPEAAMGSAVSWDMPGMFSIPGIFCISC
jgi:hypothetical protein